MKIVNAILWTIAIVGTLVPSLASHSEWECSEDCWNYRACKDGNARRALEPNALFEDLLKGDEPLEGEPEMIHAKAPAQLRGGTLDRQLGEIDHYFNLKMHWEDDYCVSGLVGLRFYIRRQNDLTRYVSMSCPRIFPESLQWQGESKERRWCMDCAGGTIDCEQGDMLEIRKCDDADEQRDQRFVYEKISGSGGGRIKPYHDQSLCLERTSDRLHTLEPCDDVEEGVSSRQILLGFDWDDDFKLIPKSRDDHCLTQNHYPRSGEDIYADKCDDSCDDNTCLWEIINYKEV